MIYGIGTDIVQISRIAAALARNGLRFAEKILGEQELKEYHLRREKSQIRGLSFLATRFAAKEAFSKALGLGLQIPMSWRAMQTINVPNGQPTIVTNGVLKEFMERHRLVAKVSISDETEYAVAFVIVEIKQILI